MLSERLAFAQRLESALTAPKPAQQIAELLRAVFVADWPLDDQRDRRLVRKVAERLDAENASDRAMITFATDLQKLLSHASSDKNVELLLELVMARERFTSVARKYFDGTISRTGFLSFVSEQPWPDVVRRRVSTMPDADLRELTEALEQRDFELLESTIGA